MHFAEVYELEGVSTAREARRHCVVVVVFEPDAPLCSALATRVVVVLGRHGESITFAAYPERGAAQNP
jgi:hypothetical protein